MGFWGFEKGFTFIKKKYLYVSDFNAISMINGGNTFYKIDSLIFTFIGKFE